MAQEQTAQGQTAHPQGVLLVGYGLAGRVFHAPLISHEPGLQLTAVVTSASDRISQAREDLPGVRVHSSVAEALDHADDVNLVVVANANRAHVSAAQAAIAAGKHVVVDKPLAGNADQARMLALAAHAAQVQLHTFQNRRWDSDFLTMKSVIAAGQLGNVHRLESRFERLRVDLKGNWRESADPEDLGGVLLDFGAHLVDQALDLLGPVNSVDAYARSVRQFQAGDDDMQILLTHATGGLSLLVGSQAGAFPEPRFTALGTLGGFRIKESDSQETRLRAGDSPSMADWGHESFAGELALGGPDGSTTSVQVPLLAGRWTSFYAQVSQAIAEGTAGPVAILDVIANLRVLDAARESVATGTRIALDPPASHV